MEEAIFSVETKFNVEFFDVDAMNIVWHGNYVKYMEIGRCALLDKLGYGYKDMVKDGYTYPVVDIKVKYVHSLVFGETATIRSDLIEYENRIKIRYEIFNSEGKRCVKAESTQMAFNVSKNESQLVCSPTLIAQVEKILSK